MPPHITNKYEQLDAVLDVHIRAQGALFDDLRAIRQEIDTAYNRGELADYQWRALVTRSAKIQDMNLERHTK